MSEIEKLKYRIHITWNYKLLKYSISVQYLDKRIALDSRHTLVGARAFGNRAVRRHRRYVARGIWLSQEDYSD